MTKKQVLLALLLVTLAVTGVTMAFLTDSHTKVNRFTPGDNQSSITETFTPPDAVKAGDKVTKKVVVKNENMPSYIRVFVAVSDSSLASKFSINYNTTDWTKDADGYYYYKKVVPKGGSTTKLFDTLTFHAALPNGSGLEIICYSESVQAEGFTTAKAAFAAIK